jgi:hypothetical protein
MTASSNTAEDFPSPDDTGQKQVLTRFKPGQSGNPAGRPKGSRNRLGAAFIDALENDFGEHGVDVIKQVRMRDPVAYTKIVANILPREVLLASLSVKATIDLNEMEDAKGFLEAYRFARDRIGAVPLVEAEPIEADEGALVTEGWRADD